MSPAPDPALWITWYDLPEEGRDDYLAWLHDIHLPALLSRPGYLWAAHFAAIRRDRFIHAVHGTSELGVPAGAHFMLLLGAAGADAFGDPTPDELRAGLPDADRRMLAMRSGERTSLMVEASRIEGAGLKAYGSGLLPAPCIQIGSFNFPWREEQELHAWFSRWRMPVLRGKPACVRIRKLVAVSGWARHCVLYEYLSPEARERDYLGHEDPYPEMRAWSKQVIARIEHAPPGTGAVATRIWPPVLRDGAD